MTQLEHLLQLKNDEIVSQPEIFDLSQSLDQEKLEQLLVQQHGHQVQDHFLEQVEELFITRNPVLKMKPNERARAWKDFQDTIEKQHPLWQEGRWVWLPWRQTLVHVLAPEEYYELRSSRNKNLITEREQERLRNFEIGIAGMSVGNSVAIALTLEGAEHLRLTDFDVLGVSNLNRLRASISDIGQNKTIMTARQIYEINPYAELRLLVNGLKDETTVEEFLNEKTSLQVFVDEMDDVGMKLRLRELARAKRIPVLSVADNGDNVIVDVERFDHEPDRPLYHGTIGNVTPESVKTMGFGQRLELINTMVGVEKVTKRMKESLLQIGKTLTTWPQLGGTAMMAGAAVAYLVKRLALDEPLASGKYEINLDRIFTPGYDEPLAQSKRDAHTQDFLDRQRKLFLR